MLNKFFRLIMARKATALSNMIWQKHGRLEMAVRPGTLGVQQMLYGSRKKAGRYGHAERDNDHQHTIFGADRPPFIVPEAGQEFA